MPPSQGFQDVGRPRSYRGRGWALRGQGAGKESVREQGGKNTEHLRSTTSPAWGSWDSDVAVAPESGKFNSGVPAISVRLSLTAGHRLPPFWRGAPWSMAMKLWHKAALGFSAAGPVCTCVCSDGW